MAKSMGAVIKGLQETATVMAGIQARQAEALKNHGEWLQEHHRVMAELRNRDRVIDERLDKLVVAIGELIAATRSKA